VKYQKEEVVASPLLFNTLKQFYIEKDSSVIGKSIVELDLPLDFLILMINRKNEYIKPTGSTLLEENDMLLIQCNGEKRYRRILKRFK
jgi:cell volume regulation protein A